MLSKENIYKIILIMLHSTVSMVLWLYSIFKHIKLKQILDKKGCSDITDIQYLSDNVKVIKRIPRHLMVNLSNEEPFLKDLANVVLWCAASGISFVSFYDYKGKLKDRAEEFYKEVKHRNQENFKILWSQKELDLTNGYKYKTSVNILSLLDSHKKVIELTKDLAKSVKSDEICIDTINKYFEVWPEPDLAFYCGNFCSTYGCPPWQLRVTEFLNLPTHHNLSVQQFVHSLKLFSKCEQRFGK